jgi:hypothetical protein
LTGSVAAICHPYGPIIQSLYVFHYLAIERYSNFAGCRLPVTDNGRTHSLIGRYRAPIATPWTNRQRSAHLDGRARLYPGFTNGRSTAQPHAPSPGNPLADSDANPTGNLYAHGNANRNANQHTQPHWRKHSAQPLF